MWSSTHLLKWFKSSPPIGQTVRKRHGFYIKILHDCIKINSIVRQRPLKFLFIVSTLRSHDSSTICFSLGPRSRPSWLLSYLVYFIFLRSRKCARADHIIPLNPKMRAFHWLHFGAPVNHSVGWFSFNTCSCWMKGRRLQQPVSVGTNGAVCIYVYTSDVSTMATERWRSVRAAGARFNTH